MFSLYYLLLDIAKFLIYTGLPNCKPISAYRNGFKVVLKIKRFINIFILVISNWCYPYQRIPSFIIIGRTRLVITFENWSLGFIILQITEYSLKLLLFGHIVNSGTCFYLFKEFPLLWKIQRVYMDNCDTLHIQRKHITLKICGNASWKVSEATLLWYFNVSNHITQRRVLSVEGMEYSGHVPNLILSPICSLPL